VDFSRLTKSWWPGPGANVQEGLSRGRLEGGKRATEADDVAGRVQCSIRSALYFPHNTKSTITFAMKCQYRFARHGMRGLDLTADVPEGRSRSLGLKTNARTVVHLLPVPRSIRVVRAEGLGRPNSSREAPGSRRGHGLDEDRGPLLLFGRQFPNAGHGQVLPSDPVRKQLGKNGGLPGSAPSASNGPLRSCCGPQ
jgi:hypothetical protein